MSNWTDERKDQVVEAYLAAEPTAENSMEIVKQIAEDMGESANGVRMILSQRGKYVKKDPAKGATAAKASSSASGDKAPRVSKEAAHKALTDAIEAIGGEVDNEIVSKLTGKAALYFAGVLSKSNDSED